MNKNADDKLFNLLESFAKNDTSAFNRLRNTFKETSDIFLLGKPSPDILFIMMKLYHENIIRNICYKYPEQIISTNKSRPNNNNSSVKTAAKFMCGIMEMESDDPDRFFITISDDPVEFADFDKKEATLISLLNHCNITPTYPEGANFKMPQDKVKWRIFHGAVPQGPILKITAQNASMNADFAIKENLLVKDSEQNEGGFNYDNYLWEKPYNINVINSYRYLEKRREEGISFPPFKKVRNSKVECVNGSTCTESKLFSYIKNNLGKNFKDIKGFATFWLGSELPPSHHHEKYSFSPLIENELVKLERIKNICLEIFSDKKVKGGYTERIFNRVLRNVVQPIAMPCPGCVSNYNKYKDLTYERWNYTGCNTAINGRHVRALASRRAQNNKAGGFISKKNRRTLKYQKEDK